MKKELPRICLLSLDDDIIKNYYEHVFTGSIGKMIRAKYSHTTNCYFLPNHSLPKNLHEYDVCILNMNDQSILSYKEEDHQRDIVKTSSDVRFITNYPQTIFGSRNFSINHALADFFIRKRSKIMIIFAGKSEESQYMLSGGSKNNIGTYDFFGSFVKPKNFHGTLFEIQKSQFEKIISKYSDGTTYDVIFKIEDDSIKSRQWDFTPLIKNGEGATVSFLLKSEFLSYLVLPNIVNKSKFILDLLETTLPDVFPSIFESNSHKWIDSENYYLPNQNELLLSKEEVTKSYLEDIEIIDKKIDNNKIKFGFLHDILTETGEVLVEAVIAFFKWVKFENVINKDLGYDKILEEDIQIHDSGVFIIAEVKGIGGTSKDEDCSQIAKIRYRRIKESKRTDIHALYIVNHQRQLEPLERRNPPFSHNQIQDAIDDERGLLTTWELFNAYNYVLKGILSLDDIKNQITQIGVIRFKPEMNFIVIGKPKEIHHRGRVAIVDLPQGKEISIKTEILIDTGSKYVNASIMNIKSDDVDVESASGSEVGIQLSDSVKEEFILWMSRN